MQYQETLRMLQIVRQQAGPVLVSHPPVVERVPIITGSVIEEVNNKLASEGIDQEAHIKGSLADQLRERLVHLREEGFPLAPVPLTAYFVFGEAVVLNRKGAAMLETDLKPNGQLTMDVSKGMRIAMGSVLGFYKRNVNPENWKLDLFERLDHSEIYDQLDDPDMQDGEKADKIMDWQIARLQNAMFQKVGFVEEYEQSLAVYAGGELGRIIYTKVWPIAEKVIAESII